MSFPIKNGWFSIDNFWFQTHPYDNYWFRGHHFSHLPWVGSLPCVLVRLAGLQPGDPVTWGRNHSGKISGEISGKGWMIMSRCSRRWWANWFFFGYHLVGEAKTRPKMVLLTQASWGYQWSCGCNRDAMGIWWGCYTWKPSKSSKYSWI